MSANNKKIWINEEWNNEQFRKMIVNPTELIDSGKDIYNKRNLLVHLLREKYSFLRRDIVIKKFALKRTYDKLRFCILSSKGVRSLRIALALKEAELNTPEPGALVERRGTANRLIYSCFITEYIPYQYIVADLLRDNSFSMKDKISFFLPFLAQDIRKMHDYGIIHNDLHSGNILISDLDKPVFYYIDLNRARIKGKLSIKQRMKDLGRLNLKKAEQSLFLQYYSPDNYIKLIDLMGQARKRRKKSLSFKRNLKRKLRRK